jgi:hypothetical protein
MAWVAEEGFEYDTGDLAGENGGSGFSAGWVNAATNVIDVTAGEFFEGSKSAVVVTTGGNTFYTRALTSAANDGVVYVAIHSGDVSDSTHNISFRNSSNGSRFNVQLHSDGDLKLNGSSAGTLVSGAVDDTWYIVEVTYNTGGTCTGKAKAAGGSYGSATSDVGFTNSGDINVVGLGGDDTTATSRHIDIISASDPDVAAGPGNLKTWNGVAAASLKTVDGVAIASLKTLDTIA